MSTTLIEGPVAKVADFGTSIRPSAHKVAAAQTTEVSNPIWKAPEILRGLFVIYFLSFQSSED